MTTPPPPAAEPSQRLLSLDALRGFDRFWIMGGDALLRAVEKMQDNATTRFFGAQLRHADFVGLTFYDLIFPLFVFIVGVSVALALPRSVARIGRAATVRRVLGRTVILVLLGIFASGGLSHPWPEVRLLGVLQRIGLCYGATALLALFLRPRALVAVCVALLVGYWAALTFIPIRDLQLEKQNLKQQLAATGAADAQALFAQTSARVSGKYEPGLNLANHFDFQFLPGAKHFTYWDPEGILSTAPAVVTCLLGLFAGRLLAERERTAARKVFLLAIFGVAGIAAGFLWSWQFPLAKKIWTSSFVLVAGGVSALALAGFYLVVDVWGWRRWCRPFVWMGANAITIYLASNLLGGFRGIATRLLGGDVRQFFETNVGPGCGELVIACGGLALAFALVRFLYQRQIFLRV